MQLKELVYSSIFYTGMTSFILQGYIKTFREVKLRNFLERKKNKETFSMMSGIPSVFIQNLYISKGKRGKKALLGSNCIYCKQHFSRLAP